MNRRKEQIEALLKHAAEHDWQSCREALFRVLYDGLPANVQLSLAGFAIQRFLPIFENKWPNITWPATLLRDPSEWLTRHGRSLPDEPPDPDPADAAFIFTFDALLLASNYQTDALILTSSCAAAVGSAINARQCAVWMADDPEGVAMWRRQGYFPGRSLAQSKPAIAVAEREWEATAVWLSARTEWIEAEAAPAEEIERNLARWREHEMSLIVPRS